MNMITALAKVGLATQNDVLGQQSQEEHDLLVKQQSMVPQTVGDLMVRNDYKFFDRVRWIIEHLEGNPQSIDEAIAAVSKHMQGGDAGKTFLAQLREVKIGTKAAVQLRPLWPKVF